MDGVYLCNERGRESPLARLNLYHKDGRDRWGKRVGALWDWREKCILFSTKEKELVGKKLGKK